MDYFCTATYVLKQISNILSEENGQPIVLFPKGSGHSGENGYVIEIEDIDIPQSLIGSPNPKCKDDKDGYYTVNRVRIGKTILDDTLNGFPWKENEIKIIIKAAKTWAYYDV